MQFLKRFTLIVLVLVVLALAIIPVLGQENSAKARFVHAIPGASAVDIYVDGQLTVSSLEFGSATDYIALPAGEYALTITQAGASTPLWQQELLFADQSISTLVASSINPLQFTQFIDDLNPLPLGKARFTAIHAIADGDAVDIVLATGQPVIPALQYNQPYGTLDLPASTYDLAVVPVGESLENALIPAGSYALNSGTSYVVLAYGTASDPQVMLLSAPTDAEIDGGNVRFIHGVPEAASVDVYVNDALVAPALAFGELTEYMALPAGDYNVTVRAAGATENLTAATIMVQGGEYTSGIVLGSTEALEMQTFSEQFGAISARESVLYVINAMTEVSSVTASLSEGDGLLADIASGTAQSALVEPTEQDIIIGVTTGEAAGVAPLELSGVFGGVVYTAIVLDGGELIVDSASIAQDLTSAPSAVVAVEPTVAEVAIQPTAAPTEIAAVQPTAALATAVPQGSFPTSTLPPQPTAAATQFTGPTGRILLDPGANLHLRQYPRGDALSLGLAPSGTILLVVGRAGAPGPVPGLVPTATTTPYVDPATVLEEDEDLVRAETWLYVIYNTPDGGSISAWVNAQFIGVTGANSLPVRLADLPAIPLNRYGEASNTAIQPPSARQNPLTLTIIGVDPSANVHVRRTPTTEGESLVLVSNGTVLDFIGLNEDQDWAFVRYRSTDGGSVRGWVNTQFVTYQRNGQPVTIEELVTRNELETFEDTERGEVEVQPAGISPTATPLRDTIVGEVINLDPGANLHMRRRPSPTAESLALLPNGTTLIITAQEVDADGRIWLQTNYQGQDGWVWSQYLRLSFNGRPYEITDVPFLVVPSGTLTGTPAGSAPPSGGLVPPGSTPALPGSGLFG